MARIRRVDPARDLLDLMAAHSQDASRQVLPQLDTGQVILVNDGTDGTVVQLDNMSVAASDCLLLGTHAPAVGDRVMVLVHAEEFWILGGIQGQSTGASAPGGAAGGDLTGTYPNPSIEPSVSLTGAPLAPTASPGTSTTQLATTAFVQAAVAAATVAAQAAIDAATAAATPTGSIKMWGTGSAPTGFLILDGSAVSRTGANAALFALWGTTFGVGDGSTTFNVPDFRGRAPIGVGTGDASDATAHALASKVGTEGHTLTLAQLASHDHSPTANGLTGSTTPGVTGGPSVASTGAGTSHAHGVGTMVANANALVTASGGTSANSGRLSVDNSQGGSVVVGTYAGADLALTGTSAAEAAHTHSMQSHTHTSAAHTHALTAQGGNTAHPNVQPSLTVNFIVKL